MDRRSFLRAAVAIPVVGVAASTCTASSKMNEQLTDLTFDEAMEWLRDVRRGVFCRVYWPPEIDELLGGDFEDFEYVRRMDAERGTEIVTLKFFGQRGLPRPDPECVTFWSTRSKYRFRKDTVVIEFTSDLVCGSISVSKRPE